MWSNVLETERATKLEEMKYSLPKWRVCSPAPENAPLCPHQGARSGRKNAGESTRWFGPFSQCSTVTSTSPATPASQASDDSPGSPLPHPTLLLAWALRTWCQAGVFALQVSDSQLRFADMKGLTDHSFNI